MNHEKQKRLAFTEQAEKIRDTMSLEEKVYLMSGRISMPQLVEDLRNGKSYNYYPYPAGGNQRLGVPEVLFVDGPRGAVCGKSTCFPVSMARGATFDPDLEERIGQAIGKEIRAHGGNLFGGVCINLPYNPGWGRSQEVYGEDSFHLGAMGSALVKGVQSQDVIATIKHYAFNSMEIARFKVSIQTSKRTEREVYLAHFKDCIDAGAACVMSAYNLYQGVYCGHSNYLLNDVLKKEWGFDGFVMSDFFWGMSDTAEAANGGMDMEMCHTHIFGDKLIQAVRSGEVSQTVIDEAALRIIRTVLAYHHPEKPKPKTSIIGCLEHINLALEAANKSMTLIQNRNNTLPFAQTAIHKIALVGKLATMGNIGDHGSSQVFPEYITTPLQGLKVVHAQAEYILVDTSNIELAKQQVTDADATIFVVGYNHDDEGEYVSNDTSDVALETDLSGGTTLALGGDRKDSLGLHQDEIDLINILGPLNKNSAAVLIGGNMIMIEEWKDSVPAILMAYYPGMEGGRAIAETLFGFNNPGGKLPFVTPFKEEHLPHIDWEAESATYNYYHGYNKLNKENITPSLPYGFGLSYTEFTISDPLFSADKDKVSASCLVKNIGKKTGDEVVQLYLGYSESTLDRPLKQLRGFSRITLTPGESMSVNISCPVEKLMYYNEQEQGFKLEDIRYEIYIGNSSADNDLLRGSIKLPI